MNGFADIHTHLLPGADDGARDMREALMLLHMAWKNGTRTMILTPHYRGSYKKNTPEWLRESFSLLCRMAEQELPGMKLYLGNEIYYEMDAPEQLMQGRILTLNGSRYALLEFRSGSLRSQIITGVSETVRHGFTPIIAHAERYDIFRADAALTDDVLNMGALIQLNADSIMGDHGLSVKWFCRRLLREQKVHFVASDAHDAGRRPPLLRECFLKVHKKYGPEYAARVFYDNAQAVIENQII